MINVFRQMCICVRGWVSLHIYVSVCLCMHVCVKDQATCQTKVPFRLTILFPGVSLLCVNPAETIRISSVVEVHLLAHLCTLHEKTHPSHSFAAQRGHQCRRRCQKTFAAAQRNPAITFHSSGVLETTHPHQPCVAAFLFKSDPN